MFAPARPRKGRASGVVTPPQAVTVGSLFSGIAGLEYGLCAGLGEAAVKWQVEIHPYCRKVLAKHYPKVPCHEDVRTVGAHNLERTQVICGGFPCNDLSPANHRGTGLAGEKSGLWSEFHRVVRELEPEAVVVENSYDAWREWVPQVRRDLWDAGYASVPLHLRAADFGAPHDRQRVFVVAATHANGKGESALAEYAQMALVREVADARRENWGKPTPGALGVADGVPDRMERLRAVGNAVMPHMSWVVGRVLKGVLS